MITDNQKVYSTVEFDSWANRGGLIRSERFLLERYLNPKLATLEAGTSGGRILLELQKQGFDNLYGFDYVPEFIERAKQRDPTGKVHYSVMDARHTQYPDQYFEQLIYLQQIISCIESDNGRRQAIVEAYRILKPGGVVLFSFLCFESRNMDRLYRVLLAWIKVLRITINKKISLQYLPWFKHSGQINWPSLLDSGPYVYWYKATEAEELLGSVGFRVLAVGTDGHIAQDAMRQSTNDLDNQFMRGHIYFVCAK